MNILDLHNTEKAVSTFSLFKSGDASTTAIQILAQQELKEHISKVPALLICVIGSINYRDERGTDTAMLAGDYVMIEPHLKHWLVAEQTSNLLLIK